MNILDNLKNNSIRKYLSEHKMDNYNFYSFIFDEIVSHGWKIHISCTINNYVEIMNLSLNYLYNNKINFKIVKNIDIYIKNSGKTGDRTSFGKFITVYPNSESLFIVIIEELYKLLKYYEGPYILSDRRYKDAKVVYYRYGSNILSNKYDRKGNAIRFFEYKNKLYIDEVKPYFDLPESIHDPLISDYNEGNSSYLLKKYEISDAIKFSPIGGVYKGRNLENNKIYVIKEIFPYTGVYDNENDAVTSAKKEIENFNKLKSFNFIPKLYEYFNDWDNLYLVRNYVPGETFEDYSGKRNPIPFNADKEQVVYYCKDILHVVKKIVNNINLLYEKGFVLTDLGPDNIIINSDVYFIDLESLFDINSNHQSIIINYTEGFWLKDNDIKKNIKYNIANLIMYALNKKNFIFKYFSENEILGPIIIRYSFIQEILETILAIKKDSTEISEIINIINTTICKISMNNYEYSSCNYEKINTFSELLEKDIKFINNILINENSIAYGQLGKILSNIYVNNAKYKKEDLILFEGDFRTPSFFYGHAGLLYINNLLNFDTDQIVDMIIKYIDYKELSLSEGISGIGIGLLYDYIISKNDKSLRVLHKINKKLINNYLKNSLINVDISLDKGLLGYSLFLIYYAAIFNDKKSKNYGKKYIDLVIRKINQKNVLNRFLKDEDYHSTEYYLKDGIYGLILVILEYILKFDDNSYEGDLIKLLENVQKVYSLSPNFYFGSSGFLYTFYKAFKVFKEKNLCIVENIDFKKNISIFYYDIINTFKNGEFMNTNFKYNNYGFLGGKEGIITVLDFIENDKDTKIFPFII